MGHTISKSAKKLMHSESSPEHETRGIIHDTTIDSEIDSDNNFANDLSSNGDKFDAKTPPNVLRLKCDPRSPSNFDRTPLKVPLE